MSSATPASGAGALASFIETARDEVNVALEQALPVPPACPPLVAEALRYSVLAGGKRLRPLLVLAAADTVAPGSRRLAMPAACAVELIHTYSLIHDDLPAMDDDSLRRGRPTLHTLYGDGIAILAGDALQAEAFNVLARALPSDPASSGRTIRVIQLIAEAAGATGMVGGQAIDLQAAGQVPGHAVVLDVDALREMHRRKTGALIRASALSGAILAGGDSAVVAAVDTWATEIGLAFQIVDDVLDVEGSASELGKTAGKDAARDKPTYPSTFGLEKSKALAAACAERARTVLHDANLTSGFLGGLGEWVVTRRN